MPARNATGEREILQRISRMTAGVSQRSIVRAIGDDCAIVRAGPEDLVFTTDLLLQGRHFLLETHRPQDVGHKCLARGLSDIAAMGAVPRFCLVSLALPAELSGRWLDGFYQGLMKLARQHQVVVAGGDLGRNGQVVADIVVCGAVPRGTALRRDAAKPGDVVYVSGPLGQSALGLRLHRGAASVAHRRPTPLVALGQTLRQAGVRCAMDVSDGLSLDAARLAEASRCAIDLQLVPLAKGATEQDALHGGEDYQLLFTAPRRIAIAGDWGVAIGRVSRGPAGQVTLGGQPLPAEGWDHFAATST